MIDPLTAFSAAGNALQFAELGVKVVLKTIEYAKGGGDIEYHRLQDLAQQLTVSNAHLHATLTKTATQPLPPGPARALYFANQECLKVANEFLNILNELRFDRTRSLWRSVMLSLKSIKTKSKIEDISARIGNARSNLVLSLLVYVQTEVSSNTQQFRADHREIIEEARKITRQTQAIQTDVAYLNTKFAALQVDNQTLVEDRDYGFEYADNDEDHLWDSEGSSTDGEPVQIEKRPKKTTKKALRADKLGVKKKKETVNEPSQSTASVKELELSVTDGSILVDFKEEISEPEPTKEEEPEDEYEQEWGELLYISTKRHAKLEDITRRLSNLLERLNREYATMSLEFDDLSPLIDRELLGRRRVLDSLYFTKMNDRRNRVARAHNQTFQWIFRKSKEHENVIWDDFFDWLCHQEHNPIYWIFGKPGCGKTTMVRELDERITQQTHLQDWTEGRDLLKLSCYFWWAGTTEQKSLLGFLRHLLHQLLQQRPDLIDKVIPASLWEDALLPQLQLRSWEENDLVRVIHNVLKATDDCKILLFVDGLDEFDGTEESREHFLDLLVNLTAYPHVKACVASRYWNIFRDRFKSCPKIRLEDLTVDDIMSYVREKLGEDVLFRKQQKRWDQQEGANLLDRVSEEIISKARGVFLWVRLVVRDLLKVLRDGGRPTQLFRELKSIPSDLDDYFARMIETVDSSYRKDASMILQTALCNLDYSLDGGQTLVSGPDLLLMHLDFLEESGDPCFSVKSQLQTINYLQDEEEIDDLLESLDRRLMSRCMGLLEIDTRYEWACKAERHPWATKVEFLHRTVRDFLLKRSTQRILCNYSGTDFDAHLFRCNTLVVNVSMPVDTNEPDLRFGSFACFFRQIQERRKDDVAAATLFSKMIQLLNAQALELDSFVDQTYHPHVRTDTDLIEWIRSCSTSTNITPPSTKLDVNSYQELAMKLGVEAHGDNKHRPDHLVSCRKRQHEDNEHLPTYWDSLAQPMLDPKIEQMGFECAADGDNASDQQQDHEYFDVLEFQDQNPHCKKFKSSHDPDVSEDKAVKVKEKEIIVIE